MIRHRRPRAMRLLAAACLGLALASPPADAMDRDAVTADLIRLHASPGGLDYAFWVAAGALPSMLPSMMPDEQRGVSELMSGYELFLVAHLNTGVRAASQATPDVRPLVRLRLPDGRVLVEIPDTGLPPTLLRVASAIKLKIEKSRGSNSTMRVVAFKYDKPADQPRIDTPEASSIALLLDGAELVWHLPLNGMGPSAIDPVNGERFPGNYEFNPYTGARLKHG